MHKMTKEEFIEKTLMIKALQQKAEIKRKRKADSDYYGWITNSIERIKKSQRHAKAR